jgi:6-phosphogluconolactonase (cycloisomerase 2 family)
MRNIRCLLVLLMLTAVQITVSCGGSNHIQIGCSPCGKANNGFVYTANAAGNPSTVSALVSDSSTGALTPVSGSPYNAGIGSTALIKDPVRAHIYVANTQSGDISSFSMNTTTGALTPLLSPTTVEAGIDAMAIDPLGQFMYVVSGNSSNLWIFSIASSGALTPLSGTPIALSSSGVVSSSVLIDVSGNYLYVTASSSSSVLGTIFGFSRNATTGRLVTLPGFSIPVAGQSNHGAFDSSGKYLLLTGNNVFGTAGGISVFSLDAATGSLTLVTGSPFQVRDDPSGVAGDATGRYVYVPNTADATISAFTLDSATGGLTPVSGSPFPSGGNGSINGPLGIAADGAGKFMYVCNASNDVSAFSINSATGALTPVGGSPFPDGGNGPSAIIFVP